MMRALNAIIHENATPKQAVDLFDGDGIERDTCQQQRNDVLCTGIESAYDGFDHDAFSTENRFIFSRILTMMTQAKQCWFSSQRGSSPTLRLLEPMLLLKVVLWVL